MPALGLIQYATATRASAGTAALVAAPGAGFQIVVVSFTLGQSANTALAHFDTATTAIMGPLFATEPVALAGSRQDPLMTCDENEALNLVTDGVGIAFANVAFYVKTATVSS